MYLQRISLENVGPIDKVEINLSFHANGCPKPCLLVGENGSGKSLVVAHIVNALLSAKQVAYDDTEVEKGKVYKYRSPTYIKSGSSFSYSETIFDGDLWVKEWQLLSKRSDFEENLKYCSIRPEWMQIPETEFSYFDSNFHLQEEKTKKLLNQGCLLYFPVNRFEEPAWLNYDNLTLRADYTDLKRTERFSNRQLISLFSLKRNQNWLLDLLLDRNIYDLHIGKLNPELLKTDFKEIGINFFGGWHGASTNIYQSILDILKVVLRTEGNIRFGANSRKDRRIVVMKDEQQWIPNIFQLSTGETQLLNLFLSILRDYDLSEAEFNSLEDISVKSCHILLSCFQKSSLLLPLTRHYLYWV
ncbi:hypothetical protein IQ266_24000 [filamentous cyanobacterium LEGE 11480]|uniref:Rad50/SbcC-type AAA domain-containing protein n=1 Tax=Romeriopsis navalis LEGE 11480 TaxID=2777977 RepID=A0A928VQT3_9CYAN|nr:hypothetical protein [Romeriopsis navalis]MBE9032805.1 hypothetical protein [Romeriopsis navalis LEGE 11480]